MSIDPKVEDATRTMLDHVLKDKLDEIPRLLQKIDADRFRDCLGLCVAISGYIAMDVLGPDWPTDGGLRRMAEHAAKAAINVELDESQIYDYLRKSAVGSHQINDVFATGEDVVTMPVFITAALILTFCPRGTKVWGYLDDIEEALEAAESVKASALPAMVLRAHRDNARQER